jgi:hypothetical protein
VRIATFGILELGARGSTHMPMVRALHVRMILVNQGPRPWTIDTSAQHVTLAGFGDSRPAYAATDLDSTPPMVTVPPNRRGTIDLFFPLPSTITNVSELPAFDAVWTVRTDARRVTDHSAFSSVRIEPRSSAPYDLDAWSPMVWYDPHYPHDAWGGVALPAVYLESPVIVRRPPAH